MHCAECGNEYILTDQEVSHHITREGDIDYDADADHVAYRDE